MRGLWQENIIFIVVFFKHSSLVEIFFKPVRVGKTRQPISSCLFIGICVQCLTGNSQSLNLTDLVSRVVVSKIWGTRFKFPKWECLKGLSRLKTLWWFTRLNTIRKCDLETEAILSRRLWGDVVGIQGLIYPLSCGLLRVIFCVFYQC